MGRPSKKPQLLEDRISKLPDDILHQILYHLSTKCTVKTSILSKRWHYLWTSTRALHFYCREFSSTSIAKFICFVDRVLFLRDNSDIEKFTLWWQSDFDIYKAKEWLSYALRFNVKEVDLFIKGSFSLPSDLLRCQSLQVLKLTSTFNEFPILKFLSTISTNLSKLKTLYVLTARPCEAITKLISKCPVLENLTMSMASCDFEISTPYLKELTFFCHHGARKVSIFAPNLVRLDVRCFFDRIPELLFECKLENLATASISCIKGCEGGLPGSGRKFLEILRCLQNAKSLTLRGNVVELLHQVSKEPLPSLCNLRSLTINLTMEKRLKVVAIQVMIMLPQKCPNLEKLVVELPKKILRQESISWECHACSLNKLKGVKIVGFHYGDEEEAGLVNFLLHHQRSSLPRVKIYYEISKKMTKKVKSLAFSLGGQP